LPRFHQRVRYRRLDSALNGALDTWDDGFRDWKEAAVGPRADGFYDLVRVGAETDILRPRGRRFGRRVAVLVDASCSSATFQFAHAVRATGLARLVGETTGGNRRGINGGAYFFVRLPETGLEVDLPIIGYFPEGREPDAGVEPHDRIETSAADIASGFDRPLRAALSWIKSG